MRWAVLWIASLVGCAAERPTPAPSAPPPRQSLPASAAPEPTPAPSVPPSAPDASAPPERVAFPPPEISPPHQRSAQPGDGKWTRLGDASRGDRAAQGEALLYRTVVHPHPISKWVSVTVAAIDLHRGAVHLVAGTDDPESKTAPPELRRGLVPAEHLSSVLAVMNGGWKTAHGHWGTMIAGHTFVPPRVEGCTIAIFKDGSVNIRAWPELESRTDEMESHRQTPPCLLSGGELHPSLQAGQERAWGGNDPKVKTRRRSALGVDATGRILFYGFGEEAGAKMLAEGMRLAGAVEAAETDINYSWTRFLLVGTPPGASKLQITSTLVPKMVHQKAGYVERAAPRDFFYVRRR